MRSSPIAAIVLTGAEVDQVAGLLTLRERQDFTVFATSDTMAALDANPIFGVLGAGVVTRTIVARDQPFALPGGLAAELFAVPGKVALYLEGEDLKTPRWPPKPAPMSAWKSSAAPGALPTCRARPA